MHRDSKRSVRRPSLNDMQVAMVTEGYYEISRIPVLSESDFGSYTTDSCCPMGEVGEWNCVCVLVCSCTFERFIWWNRLCFHSDHHCSFTLSICVLAPPQHLSITSVVSKVTLTISCSRMCVIALLLLLDLPLQHRQLSSHLVYNSKYRLQNIALNMQGFVYLRTDIIQNQHH